MYYRILIPDAAAVPNEVEKGEPANDTCAPDKAIDIEKTSNICAYANACHVPSAERMWS